MDNARLDFASATGFAGAERAAEKVQRVSPGWLEQSIHWLRLFAIGSRKAKEPNFTMEEAREYCEALNPRPDGCDGRVWGAITVEALRRGYIVRLPGVYRAAVSSNGSPKACYACGADA